MCSVSRTSTPTFVKAIKDAGIESQEGAKDLLGRPIKKEGKDKKGEASSVDGEIATSTNPNPQNTKISTPTVEKEKLEDRMSKALKEHEKEIRERQANTPTPTDSMANQPPMTPPSSSGSSPSPSPSSPSSSRPSSSGSPELKNTITSLRGALKKQDEQIANLQKALVNRDKNKIDPLRPPKFGDEKKSEEKTKVAESKSEDTTKEKSEDDTKLAETIPKKENDEFLVIDFSSEDDTPGTEIEHQEEIT